MAFPRSPRRSAPSSSSFRPNNSNRNSTSRSERPSHNSNSGSLSSRFSSLAAERISSRSEPSRGVSRRSGSTTVTKPTSGRRHHRRNDRGMEVDQVGSNGANNGSNNNVLSRGNHSRRHQSRNGGSNRNGPASGGPRNRDNNGNSNKNQSRPKKSNTPAPNQSDLDKELESYMMKNDSTARNTLDIELDSYMSSAPSKSN